MEERDIHKEEELKANRRLLTEFSGKYVEFTGRSYPFDINWNLFMQAWYKFRRLSISDLGHRVEHSQHIQKISHAICFSEKENPEEAFNLLVQGVMWYISIFLKNEKK